MELADEEMSEYAFTSPMTMPSKSGVSATADSVVIKQLISVLHNAIEVMVWHPHKCEQRWLVVHTRELLLWKCIPLLVSSCCDIKDA